MTGRIASIATREELDVIASPLPHRELAAAAALPALPAGYPPHVQAMFDPATYPHPADDIQMIETHISWVFLVGPYAYKMKKPVNFGFLDFSTLERRLADCIEEVRLNRRLCRDVYRGVESLVQRDGGYGVGSPGRLVEPLVWMHRLPAEGMLPNLLKRHEADGWLMRRIAHRIERFHATAATGPGVDEHGSLAAIEGNWRQNFEQMAPFVGRTIDAATNQGIRAYVERFLNENDVLLAERVAAGRIRDGHGDLHAGSICVDGAAIHLFDCLEFSAAFRCGDVAAEVAFLAMDLDHHGRANLAAIFVDAYVRASGDEQLLDLLDFYRCYRAYVRGKVLSFRLAEPALGASEAAEIAAEARSYFDLAATYAGDQGRPRVVMVMGPPASGKTTLAIALASRLAMVHISSDIVRKEVAGLPATAQRHEAFGEGLYSPAATRHTYAAMRERAARWLRQGTSVVLDATFGKQAERAAVERMAARLGVPLDVLVCAADEATLVARLAARAVEGPRTSDARLELWPALWRAYTAPTELPDAKPINTEQSPARAVEEALDRLRARATGDA